MTHDEMIAVIQAHKEGKELQLRPKPSGKFVSQWVDLPKDEAPQWNFHHIDYRVKREPRVWYARYDEHGRVGSSGTNRKMIERYHQMHGGEFVKFVEVMED